MMDVCETECVIIAILQSVPSPPFRPARFALGQFDARFVLEPTGAVKEMRRNLLAPELNRSAAV